VNKYEIFTLYYVPFSVIGADYTADFKVTVSGQFASRIFAGGLAVRVAYLEDFKAARAGGH